MGAFVIPEANSVISARPLHAPDIDRVTKVSATPSYQSQWPTSGTATVAFAERGRNQYQGLMDDCPPDEHSCWRRRTGWVDQG